MTAHPDPRGLFPDLDEPIFEFIDLFAGIGGIRSGLSAAGGRCVFTVESDPFAMQTYSGNFPRLGPDGVPRSEQPRNVRQVHGRELPQYQLLAAGFPCQPFSLAGVSKKQSLGRSHGFDDQKSGNLFFEITRLLRQSRKRPAVLFLENVKHLTSHDGGNTFRVIMEHLDELGYNVSYDIIDARYWVPQHRERTFIVGLHRTQLRGQRFVFPADRPSNEPRLGGILQPSVDAKYTLSEALWTYLQDYRSKHRAAGNGFGYGLVTPDSVTRTLSARYHKDGSEILLEQPGTRPRRLTPRECARLMGFPDEYVIPETMSDTQAWRQFGNSVVVPVVEFLAREMAAQVWPEKWANWRRREVQGQQVDHAARLRPEAGSPRRARMRSSQSSGPLDKLLE